MSEYSIILDAQGPAESVRLPKGKSNFRDLFCERSGHKTEKFEKKLFWKLMNPDLKALAFVIGCVRPGFFRKDFEYIRRIAYAEDKSEVIGIINRFAFDREFNGGLLRGFFHVRISGRRLVQVANQLF
jgi:hypothetical protein